MLAHVRHVRPCIVIMESVDEILKPSSDGNLSFLWASLEDIGYAGASKILKSQNFGLPCARVRAYFVLFDCAAFGCTHVDARHRALETLELVDHFNVDALPLTRFLLKKTDPRIAAELNRRQDTATGTRDLTFKDLHQSMLSARGLSWKHLVAPQKLLANPWFAILPVREKARLVWMFRPVKSNLSQR